MGWLKKLTKPISKVLDKIIPNEIKPALPYLAAFAPFMMGPQGIMGSSMLRRGLMSGALNLGSQLAQEGSEGEFDPLSLALASGIGAMTSPDAPGFFQGMQKSGVPGGDPNIITGADAGFYVGEGMNMPVAPDKTGIMASVKDAIGKGGETASKFLIEQGDILRPGADTAPLTMKNALTAASVPVTQGTADLAMITARQALDDYNEGLEEGSEAWYDDNARRVAIRSAMEAAGHVEDDILDALSSLGLKDGGRVGRAGGGILNAKRGLVDGPGGYAGKRDPKNIATRDLIEIVMEGKGTPEILVELELRMPGAVEQIKMEMIGGKKVEEGSQIFKVDEEALSKYNFLKPDIQESFLYDLRENNPDVSGEYKRPVDKHFSFTAGPKMKEGGMMSVLPRGVEMDYRGGGMIPMGSKERADDVPARLSKNEFVMTADAVRAAGGGSVNRGAKRMYDLMHNLEARV